MTAPWQKLVGPTNQILAMEQLNRLQDFRQAVYQNGFTRRGDAQQELLDALLLAPPVRSFPELTLQPVFRRHWHSAYAALDQGQQDTAWLTSYLTSVVANDPRQRRVEVFPLDETAWPRPDAPTVEDRGYVHSATPDIDGAGIVGGHSYSILAWSAEPETSWVLPVSIERVASSSDAIAVGVDQVKHLLNQRDARQCFDVVVADGRYGNHRFLGALREQPCGVLARLRADRVLYGEPGPYGGRGRPRKHGRRFAFKEPETWGAPDQRIRLVDARFGQVELCLWHGLHAKNDAETVFSVLLCRVHLERAKASKPLWLAWQAPAVHRDESAEALWHYYRQRAPLEQAIRYRKHALQWTLPQVRTLAASLRWTSLVTLAQWTLFLARDLVVDAPLPWQRRQVLKTPGRVRQGFGGLFAMLGTPALAPKQRGKAPGWPVGRQRRRPARYAVVKKGSKRRRKRRRRA